MRSNLTNTQALYVLMAMTGLSFIEGRAACIVIRDGNQHTRVKQAADGKLRVFVINDNCKISAQYLFTDLKHFATAHRLRQVGLREIAERSSVDAGMTARGD